MLERSKPAPVAGWLCAKCGVRLAGTAMLSIHEDDTRKLTNYCFNCGIKALQQRMTELTESKVVNRWHFGFPKLARKKQAYIAFVPELVEH